MPLTTGERLGPYEILALIGKGGMGEVYRAHDPRMGRDVAIKISAESFSERFDGEVRAVAALNHPNICHVYDVGPNYLVMELIEGESPQGPLPVKTALRYAEQIAEALEAAHEKGIVHCDLKPSNIKILPDGRVKVLDFGLAKVAIASTFSTNAADTPTAAINAGIITGTPAYMSPEQVRGKAVDKRADIWAFGVVLYELLVGRRPFVGETASDIVAAVLTKEPEWDQVPAKLHRLLASCLQKEPRRRLHDVADFSLLLDDMPPPVRRRSWLHWSAAALLAAVLVPLLFVHFRSKAARADPVRFQFSVPGTFDSIFYLSPDGRRLGYTAARPDGRSQLWVRALDSLESRLLPGTEDAGAVIWSPDSRFIAFSAGGKLKKIDASGGPPLDVCDLKSAGDPSDERPGIVPGIRGGSWSRQGIIIFGSDNVLFQVPAEGGTASRLTALDPSRQETYHARPLFLPDGRHFLYLRSSNTPENSGIYVGSLDTKPEEQGGRRLLGLRIGVGYAASEDGGPGYLVFLREDTLMAQPFHPGRLELTGQAVPVAEHVGDNGIAAGYFTVSDNGILAYRGSNARNAQLTLFDRQGKVLGMVGEPGVYSTMSLSPDGKRVAAERIDSQTRSSDLWIFELAGGGRMRFTSGATATSPVWSPDGNRIAFASDRSGHIGIYQKASSGVVDPELLFRSPDPMIPTGWSRDGRFLLGHTLGQDHLWLLPLDQGNRQPFPLTSQFNEVGARFSSDNRWIAYRSNESGKFEIYVRPFHLSAAGSPSLGSEWMISQGGGDGVRWRADRKELFYMLPDGTVMSVEVLPTAVSGEAGFQVKVRAPLFKIPAASRSWDVTPDGKQFLMPVPVGVTDPAPFTIVLNWPAELKR